MYIVVIFKYAQTVYLDRNVISTSIKVCRHFKHIAQKTNAGILSEYDLTGPVLTLIPVWIAASQTYYLCW